MLDNKGCGIGKYGTYNISWRPRIICSPLVYPAHKVDARDFMIGKIIAKLARETSFAKLPHVLSAYNVRAIDSSKIAYCK
jgi:hypothetical protein